MPDHTVSDFKVDNFWRTNDETYVGRRERASIDAMLWHRSLIDVNCRRCGRPYVLPPSMFEAVRGLIVELSLSIQAAEGHRRCMLSVLNLKAHDHTTIWKRLAAENARQVVAPRTTIIAIYSTGFSTTLRSEWLRDKWHKRRGFVKAHVAVDIVTQEVLGVVVTDQKIGDSVMFDELMDQVLARDIVITRVLADGGCDTHQIFDFLHRHGKEASVKTSKDATLKSGGVSFARPLTVRERNSLGQRGWKARCTYS